MPLSRLVKKHLDKIVLGLVLLFICFKNFTPGTFLIGWDNLLPELNIWLNLKRSLFAVWQEYQGLGLVGGMGHATDLIRQLIILPFTLILPINLVRYLWQFAMLFGGTFGIYFGLKNTLRFTKSVSFLGALFYLLNFGTIQYFWAPLESFSTFWGFFPWLIFSLWNYLDNQTSANLKKLLLINLLAIPSFYVQTLFVVYIICVSLILLAHFITSKKFSNLKLYSSIALMLFLINSFWLLPQIYFLKANLKNPVSGIGNFMSSDESFARNQYRGYLPDFFLLRGYYLDFPDTEGQFMAPWSIHFTNQYTLICGYILSSIFLLGLIYLLSQSKKLDFKKFSLLLMFSLTALALLSATPPFAQINSLLRLSGLVNQIFRSPFTKFIVPAAFSFSLLTAYGLKTISNLLTQIKYSQKIFTPLLIAVYCLLFTIFSYPVFTGNFISPKFRRQIPPEYFNLFSYLQTQSPSARIGNLPSGSFWGWTNYRWGYRGSGFLWYALPQPVLDRAFDAWNLNNEQYYWELDQALQKKDPYLLSRVLKKYSVEYLLFDNNIYFPDEFVYSKLSLATKDLLDQTPGVKLDRQFGQISLYRTSVPTSPYLLTNPINTSVTNFFFEDNVFQQHQDYLSATNDSSLDYPFLNLFANRLQSEFPYHLSLKQDNIIITRKSDYSAVSVPMDNSTNLQKDISLPSNQPNSSHLLSDHHSYQLLAYNFPNASLSKSYLVKVDYQYLAGLPLTISVNSDNRQQKYLFTRLDKKVGVQTAWFILPAHETSDFNQGITVLFNNNSLNNLPTQNKIFDVNLYPIPYYDLAQQSSPPSVTISERSYLDSENHLFYYQVFLPSNSNVTSHLVFPQSFSPGWLAFYFHGFKPVFLTNHVLVNNWANGWEINNLTNKTIFVLFWPQFLEFLGFGLLFLLLLAFLCKYLILHLRSGR